MDCGSVRISRQELEDIDISLYMSCEQALLRILKNKGVPIEGSLLLSFNSNYEITRTSDHMSNHEIFTWKGI